MLTITSHLAVLGIDNLTCLPPKPIVATPILNAMDRKEASIKDQIDVVGPQLPTKRIGVPDDVANIVSFLASRDSDCKCVIFCERDIWNSDLSECCFHSDVTGQTLHVNGGLAFT